MLISEHVCILYTQRAMKNVFIKICVAVLILGLASCGATKNPLDSSKMNSFNQLAAPSTGEQIAVIKTNKGTIKMRLFPQYAPENVKNFVELSKKGFYNGLKFHRVIPNFMIQGGDPLGTGYGGESYKGPGVTLPDEFSPDLKNIRGALSMANSGPNTATSQFFIVQGKAGASHLNGKHTVLGQVFEGMDVVDAIANVTTDEEDAPKSPVIMETVTIQ